ncbi:MAG TPA: radical SAM protein [Methylomirabilota bacterium]|nr:radical SAM protein [Methylomirabilota bacterium]
MNTVLETATKPTGALNSADAAFGSSRDFIGNRFIYAAISARARGLSVGVNLNPDKQCNFNCTYCEVDRLVPGRSGELDLDAMAAELQTLLALVDAGKLHEHSPYALLPPELLRLRHVAISGDGEPTLCPQFRAAVEMVVHVRATSPRGFFKIVLITNASNLDAPEVQNGLQLLTRRDEIWAKLETGTQTHMAQVNKTDVSLEHILSNILLVARQRPVVIQSLFPALNGQGPTEGEVGQYVQRLKELKDAGAQIKLVQIYSATRPAANSVCGHLPLRTLSQIAQAVRSGTGLKAEVF